MNTNTKALELGSVSTDTQSGGWEVDDVGLLMKNLHAPAA